MDFVSGLSIKSDEQKELKLRFSPIDTNIILTNIHIYGQPCDFYKSFIVTGRPRFSQTIISIDTIQAKSGEIVEIPINIIMHNTLKSLF